MAGRWQKHCVPDVLAPGTKVSDLLVHHKYCWLQLIRANLAQLVTIKVDDVFFYLWKFLCPQLFSASKFSI